MALPVVVDFKSAVPTSSTVRSHNQIDYDQTDSWQGRLRRRAADSFFSLHFCETAILEERVSDHGHKRVAMKTLP